MVWIRKENFSLFTTIGRVFRSSMLVKVKLIFCVNYSVMVGIDHLEQVLRLAVGDLQPGDLLNRLLELPLHVKGQRRIFKMSTFSILLLKT